MNLLKRIKTRARAWWQNNGHRKAYEELKADGGIVLGRMPCSPPEGWTETVSMSEVLGVIDQFIESEDACAEDTRGTSECRLHIYGAELLLELREHFVQETAPTKK